MRPASSRENASILLVAEKTPDLQCQHTSCISFCHSGCFSLRMRSLLLRVITDYVKTSPKQSCPSNHHSCYKKKKHKQPLSQAHRRGPSADPPTFQWLGAMHQSASCKTDASGNITSKAAITGQNTAILAVLGRGQRNIAGSETSLFPAKATPRRMSVSHL